MKTKEDSNGFTIRKGILADAMVIARFNQLMALETENKTLADELIVPGVNAVLKDPAKGHYYVTEHNGEVVGQLMITFEWSDWRNSNIWWIQSVYVKEEYRNKGIYKALYQKVLEDAKLQEVKTIRLYVEKENLTARSVYQKLGMEKSNYLMYESSVE